MHDQDKLNHVRGNALEKIDRTERAQKLMAVIAAGFEVVGLAAFLLLMDFSNRTHVLLLLAAFLVYGVIVLWLLSLRFYLKQSTLRVLQAIETLDERQ